MERDTRISPLELDRSGERSELISEVVSRLESVPTFALLPEESKIRRIASNLAACLRPLPKPPIDRAFAPMFRTAYVRQGSRTRPLFTSLLLHIGVAACLLYLPSLPGSDSERLTATALDREYKVLYFNKADLLPPVAPANQAPAAAQRKVVSVHRQEPPARAPVQVVISRPPKPDNTRQTIVEPDAPNLRITAHIEVPNIVLWHGVVVPPRPEVADATRQLAQVPLPRLPRPVVTAPLPEPPQLAGQEQKISDLKLTAVPLAPMPAEPPPAPVPARTILARTSPVPETPPAAPPRIPDVNPEALRNLIAVGIAPAPPPETLKVPEGNRSGEFAVTPGSRDNQAAKDDAALPALPGAELDRNLADIRVPGLSISGERPVQPSAPVVAVPPAPLPAAPVARAGNLKDLMARAARPPAMPLSRPSPARPAATRGTVDPYFGSKRVYTVAINMPNLTSGSGSWVLQFAELYGEGGGNLEADEISSPVALRKVDPPYVPSAVRERVEGTVLLAAHILHDGKVSDVRVVRGLDSRLDSSAAEALAGWEFAPAKKRGVPVDLEVLVQIPFRLPVTTF